MIYPAAAVRAKVPCAENGRKKQAEWGQTNQTQVYLKYQYLSGGGRDTVQMITVSATGTCDYLGKK